MKVHPIVFLDIDGVLNSRQWLLDPRRRESRLSGELDPTAVTRLNRLLESTGAHVVISSTWRFITPTSTVVDALKSRGFCGTVIGITPDHHGEPRGHEIQAWLDQQAVVPCFVILDDDSDMGELRHRLVKTSFETGLTEEDVDKAIVMIKRSEALLSGALL